ncbi:MAG: hypothetical protein R3A13_06530 [Bdellovibrionota bacterium]
MKTESVIGKGTNSYSFSLQYISLILIVLCFVVGSVTQQKIRQAPLQTNLVLEDTNLTMMVVENLFKADSTEFIETEIQTLDHLMSSHDLGLKLWISETSKSGQNLDLALARAVVLHKHFEMLGVPATALEITIYPQLTRGQVQFSLNNLEEL